MPNRVVFLNGRFVPEKDARVSIFDAGMQYGEMAFESTRTFGGEPFHLSDHLDRLYETLVTIGIDCGLSIEHMEQATRETLNRNKTTESAEMEWQIVHNVSRGPLTIHRTAFQEELQPTVLIYCWPLVAQLSRLAPLYRNGVDLVIPAQRHIPPTLIDPRAKTRSRAHSALAMWQAERLQSRSWPVLLDPEGNLTEGPAWNLFLAKDRVLYTPAAEFVLPGISRQLTIEIANEIGMEVREQRLTRADAIAADEICCTATSFCMVPAKTFDGHTVGAGKPGPICGELMDRWKGRVGIDFVAQAERAATMSSDWEQKEMKALRGGDEGRQID